MTVKKKEKKKETDEVINLSTHPTPSITVFTYEKKLILRILFIGKLNLITCQL